MNPRLLSKADIANNRRGRVQRQSKIRRARRHEAARHGLQHPAGLLLFVTGDLSEADFHAFQHGDPNMIRRLVRLIDTDPVVQNAPPHLPQVPEDEKKVVLPPIRCLQRTHRGAPLCRFTSPRLMMPPDLHGAQAITEYFRRDEVICAYRSACRFRALEAAKGFLSYMKWEQAAEFLFASGLVDRPFTGDEIESLRLAVSFDSYFQEARDRYAAMLPIYGIKIARGDWGAWKHSGLDRLRPRIKIPTRLRRQLYLINRLDDRHGEAEELHFYSTAYHPLFRLPLRAGREGTGITHSPVTGTPRSASV